MNLYFELLKTPVFAIEDVDQYYNNIHSARSAVGRLMREGLVVKIRNNMYTCINGETKAPLANRFQIASRITLTSYVSHHTAMEYYGLTDQVFYEVYVSSETSFRDFEFDGYTYHFVKSKGQNGVVSPEYSGGISITDMERTMIDCIKDMDKIAGAEEVIRNISGVHSLQEKRLLTYLDLYQNQFLYQKSGYLLQGLSDQLNLSDRFFEVCKTKIGNSKRYITSDIKSGSYNDEWRLVIPEVLSGMKNGVTEDAAV